MNMVSGFFSNTKGITSRQRNHVTHGGHIYFTTWLHIFLWFMEHGYTWFHNTPAMQPPGKLFLSPPLCPLFNLLGFMLFRASESPCYLGFLSVLLYLDLGIGLPLLKSGSQRKEKSGPNPSKEK